MQFLLSFIFLFLTVKVFAVPLMIDNSDDYQILNQFFKIMFVESEYGYVIDGSKPVSLMHITPLEDLIVPQTNSFKISVLAKQAIITWKQLHPQQEKNYILKIKEEKDVKFSLTTYQLSFINIAKLKNILEANIDLFQYVLGPTLTPEKLTVFLANSQESTNEIIQNDKALQGIILGFGAHNSIMHSRAENIQNSQMSNDILPFTANSNLMSKKAIGQTNPQLVKKLFLSYVNNPAFVTDEKHFSIPGPKLGFANSEEELDDIVQCFEETPKSLMIEKPRFIFGAYKHPSNEQLFTKLMESQKRVSQIADRKDFLEYVLEKITGEPPIITAVIDEKPYRLDIKPNSEESIAKVLWQMSSHFDEEAVPDFIEAFCRGDHSEIKKKVQAIPKSLAGLKRARSNLEFADNWFATVPRENKYEEIVPGHLYYEQVRVGKGDILKQQDKALVSYVIEDGFGNILSAQHKYWLRPSHTISGFAHGIQGMKEGETRILYIHPAFAYGVLTTLPPCLQLQVKVTLHELDESSVSFLPDLQPIDLAWVKDPEFYRELESEAHELATGFGTRWGSWLKQSSDISFQEVCHHLQQLAEEGARKPPTKNDEEACNRVFWNLITNSDKL